MLRMRGKWSNGAMGRGAQWNSMLHLEWEGFRFESY